MRMGRTPAARQRATRARATMRSRPLSNTASRPQAPGCSRTSHDGTREAVATSASRRAREPVAQGGRTGVSGTSHDLDQAFSE